MYHKLLTDPGRWTEDSTHENGNYRCVCIFCKKAFIGHKRRVVCKVCANEDNDDKPIKQKQED